MDKIDNENNYFHKKNVYTGLIIFLVSVFLLTLLDQWTKIAATDALKGKKPFVLINGVLEFSYLENTGTAWGMFGGARIIFLVLTLIVFAVIVWVVLRMPQKKSFIPLYITAILLGAGAAGNFIDRLFLGYVRDFIYFKWIHFPVFNVADSYVTVGVILFAVLIFFVYQEEDFAFLKRQNKSSDKNK